MTDTPITVHGRNRYADTPLTEIVITDKRRREVLVIEGGYVETRGDTFVLAAKHPSATDEEHDSSYVAMLEGAGLAWKDMIGPTHYFTGVLLRAQFYVEDPVVDLSDVCEDCEEPHGFLSFVPPKQPWTPGLYYIAVRHLAEKKQKKQKKLS